MTSLNDVNQFSRILEEAMSRFAEAMAAIEEGATHLNCGEANAIFDLLNIAGEEDAAACFMEYHADGDDDVDDDHHARYLEIMSEHGQMDAEIHAARRAELTSDQR